jgi:hypothetical protein
MESAKCPICGSNFFGSVSETDNEYHCHSCGNYKLDCKAEEVINLPNITEDKLCDFAGYLFETNRTSETFKSIKLKKVNPDEFCFEDEVYCSGLVPKTAIQKIDKFIKNIYSISISLGQRFQCTSGIIQLYGDSNKQNYNWQIAYVNSNSELLNIIDYAHQLGYIEYFGNKTQILFVFKLTIRGLHHAESLISTNTDSNQIFIAFKFNDPDSDNPRKEFEKSVKEACETASDNKLKAIILPDVEYNDGISDRIKYEIRRSKAVIADYTYESPNVYFEAGYADALGIPIIRCCNKEWADKHDGGADKAVHFDERHNNLIFWNDYVELKKRVGDRIRSLFM